MFKRGLKKILCTGLVLTTFLGLTACGKKTAVDGEVSGWGEDNAALAREFVYTVDNNGNKIEYEYKLSIGGESIVLPNMTEEQATKFIEFVESIDKCVYHDEDIEAIINDEVASFLAGQKSSSEVASVIQSRVEIYVNENR